MGIGISKLSTINSEELHIGKFWGTDNSQGGKESGSVKEISSKLFRISMCIGKFLRN